MYELVEHKGGGLLARFYVDGVRVSRHVFEALKDKAHEQGRVFNMLTRGFEKPNGKTRRVNYTTIELKG